MGKLIKYQLKNQGKLLGIFIVIPLVLLLVSFFTAQVDPFKLNITMGFGMAITAVCVIAAIIYTAYRDYHSYYGNDASFFHTLPISPKEILGARFFTLFIVFAILIILMVFCLFAQLYINASALKPAEFSAFIGEIEVSLEQINGILPMNIFLILAITLIISLIFTIFKILFSISIGSEQPFKKLGVGGPILIFIIVSVIESFISDLIGDFMLQDLNQGYIQNALEFDSELLKTFLGSNYLILIGFIILFSAILGYRTYINLRDKLSVY